jgi:succinate dehydrogenase / fumarate reductase flavoprotein subunit
MWDKCGMARNEVGLKEAIEEIKALRKEFWSNVRILVMQTNSTLN